MADFKKRASNERQGPTPEVVEELRRTHGIETLEDDEELIDDATFSKMHEHLAIHRTGAAPDPAAASQSPVKELDELLLEEVATELPPDRATVERATGQPGYEAPPESPGEVAALEAKLAGAGDRDAVARLALRLARRYARAAALLVVNQGVIAGIRGEGEELEDRIEGVMISTSVEGLFAQVATEGQACRVAAPYHGMDARVLGAMGRSEANDVLVVPVTIRGRVVNLFYADNGPDPLPTTSIAALRALAGCVAEAYEHLILVRKSTN